MLAERWECRNPIGAAAPVGGGSKGYWALGPDAIEKRTGGPVGRCGGSGPIFPGFLASLWGGGGDTMGGTRFRPFDSRGGETRRGGGGLGPPGPMGAPAPLLAAYRGVRNKPAKRGHKQPTLGF